LADRYAWRELFALALEFLGEHARCEGQRLCRGVRGRRPRLLGCLREVPAVYEVFPQDHAEREVARHVGLADPQRPRSRARTHGGVELDGRRTYRCGDIVGGTVTV